MKLCDLRALCLASLFVLLVTIPLDVYWAIKGILLHVSDLLTELSFCLLTNCSNQIASFRLYCRCPSCLSGVNCLD